MHLVDETGSQVLSNGSDTSSNPDISPSRRLSRKEEGGLYPAGDEMKDRATFRFDPFRSGYGRTSHLRHANLVD